MGGIESSVLLVVEVKNIVTTFLLLINRCSYVHQMFDGVISLWSLKHHGGFESKPIGRRFFFIGMKQASTVILLVFFGCTDRGVDPWDVTTWFMGWKSWCFELGQPGLHLGLEAKWSFDRQKADTVNSITVWNAQHFFLRPKKSYTIKRRHDS